MKSQLSVCLQRLAAAGKKGYERTGVSGFVLILPFMEEQALYDQFDIDRGDGVWLSSYATP